MANRAITYPIEVPFEADILRSQLNLLNSMAAFIDCIIGDVVSLNGFNAIPSAPPALSVDIERGQIYSLQETDATPYSTFPADTTQIMKQGMLATTQTLSTPAPGTVGESIKYLIQIAYEQVDGDPENRPFFEQPSQIVNNQRFENAVVEAKAGTPAATGTEVAPAPDAGFTGAWIVTVANGQTTVTSGDILRDPSAPFILEKLQDKSSGSGAVTGDMEFSHRSATNPKAGWMSFNIDGSIGSATSGATVRANADAEALFEFYWNNVANAEAPVSGGRGASAAADWAANKNITLPRLAGRAVGIAGQGGVLTNRLNGQFDGQETHTLIEAEMPSHTHSLNNATDIIQGAGPNDSPQTASTGNQPVNITVNATGGGGSHNNVQPTGFLNVFIKL